MIKVKSVFNVTLLLLFFLDASAQLQSLWKIGNLDNSGNEFALAPHQYKDFVAGFGGENTVYFVGHSAPKDWPYVMPGPLDSWGGGGYWSGFHPRHFPRIFFNLDHVGTIGKSRLLINFVDVNDKKPPLIRIEINGHRKEIQINAGKGSVLDSMPIVDGKQVLEVDVPNEWLRKGLNIIQIGSMRGSWCLFDCISFEAINSTKLGKGYGTLVISAKAADFELVKEGKRIQPALIDMDQLDTTTTISIAITGQKPVSRKVEKGHSILEIPMAASPKTKKTSTKMVTILSGNKIIYTSRIACSSQPLHRDADYVDLLMGTGNSRWMFKPGPSLPLSMVQIAPDNQDETWKAGYEYTIDNIMGFSHFSDWTMCSLLLMPTGGKLQITPGKQDDPDGGYRSRIDKKTESAQIGKYSVFMTDTRIKAEITATRRAALQRYTFPKMDSARIMVDLFTPNEYPHNLINAKITRLSSTAVEGEATYYNAFTGYSLQQLYTVYFVLQFSKPFSSMGGWTKAVDPVTHYIPEWNRNHEFPCEAQIIANAREIRGSGSVGIFLNYKTADNEVIQVRSGVSLVDIEGARNNLKTELAGPFGWDFDRVVQHAKDVWNEYLGRTSIETGDYLQKIKYYTNLYRAIAAKSIWSDVDGRYRDENEQVRKLENKDDCIIAGEYWNTFWNNQQLFNLVAPEISSKWARSAIALYKNSGWFNTDPAGIEHTGVMVAMHVISQVQGAWQSGVRDFDLDTAFSGFKKMMTIAPQRYPGGGTVGVENIVPYMKYGYIPLGKGEVSNTMEYAFDDWCLSQMAASLNRKQDQEYFIRRSENWRNIFDSVSGFVRPKDSAGNWITPFDPYNTPGFVEGNAFNYTWFVPQDPVALIEAMNRKRFVTRLNDAMERSSRANFNASGDNFANYPVNHGNEPAMHVAYLFNWAGKPSLTQKWVRAIQEQYYGTTPYDAYPGDEDLGQMSSWFVMSALGLFQTDGGCSPNPVYEIGSPRYPKVVIRLNNQYGRGKIFVIVAHNASKENKYIRSARLNGKTITDFRILQSDVLKGGKLELEMGAQPVDTNAR